MTLANRATAITPTPHRWRVDDYLRAAEAGSFDSQKVELIDGEVIDMPAQNDPHAWTISRLLRELNRLFPDPYWIKVQATLRLNDSSAPEPDIAVLSGPPSPPANQTPTPLLIIEVSESTLDYDRGPKASLYAANGISDYWVVDVTSRQVEVFRSPIRDASRPFGWRFQQITIYKPGDRLAPLVKPEPTVEVSAFLG